jgi:hypothetical protein
MLIHMYIMMIIKYVDTHVHHDDVHKYICTADMQRPGALLPLDNTQMLIHRYALHICTYVCKGN